MSRLLSVTCDSVAGIIRLFDDDKTYVEVRAIIQSSDVTTILSLPGPLYYLQWATLIKPMQEGYYSLTDIAMPTFISMLVDCVKHELFYGPIGIDDDNLINDIEVKYYTSDGSESDIPLFISDMTFQDEIDKLPLKQNLFFWYWQDFLNTYKGVLTSDVISDFENEGVLDDLLCLVNVRLGAISLGGNSDG